MDKEKLSFNNHYKELLLERDFEYFLDKWITGNDQYKKVEIDVIYMARHAHLETLKTELKQDKKQFLNFLHGNVVLMFEDGYLPGHFMLDGSTREIDILDFEGFGKNWAIFELWQKYEKKKMSRKTAWDYIIKTGAVLGIVLTILKLTDLFFTN